MISSVKQKLIKAYFKTLTLTQSFKKNSEGAVALEFGFIAFPFFLLLFAILEISLVFMAEINLAHATAETARKLRTGQTGIETLEKFKKDICNNVVFIPNCEAKIKVEVRTYTNFSSVDTSITLTDDGGLNDENFLFQSVPPNTIATVRTFFEWELFAKIPDLGLGNLPNNNRLVQGFTAFRSEPTPGTN